MMAMMLREFWNDERGYVFTTELVLIAVISVVGVVVGLVTVRNAVVQEYGDTATAVGVLDQSYRYDGDNHTGGDAIPGTGQFVAGSEYVDNPDACEVEDVAGQPPAGISISVAPVGEGT